MLFLFLSWLLRLVVFWAFLCFSRFMVRPLPAKREQDLSHEGLGKTLGLQPGKTTNSTTYQY